MAYQIKRLIFKINGFSPIHHEQSYFWTFATSAFLQEAVSLEPLSLFLYTWRFLEILEKEEEAQILKRTFRLLAIFTILILPVTFLGTFMAHVISIAKCNAYFDEGKF